MTTETTNDAQAFHLLTMTKDIVCAAAQGANAEQLAEAIKSVHAALSSLADPAPVVPELSLPAVSIKKSLTPTTVTCLCCGKGFKSIKRHLRNEHAMTPEEYRERWNLPADYPMVAPEYSAKRSQLAKDNGLGKKP